MFVAAERKNWLCIAMERRHRDSHVCKTIHLKHLRVTFLY